ncbi:MAG: hypothetical protein QOE60_2726 [Thermoleophilaceae bacterium]|nr:hypothetical protein [Thermoleophilaceae bacterium]
MLAVALVYAAPIQPVGWNETAHYALIQALADGTPIIDDHLDNAPTGDKVRLDGHWYSDRAPGLAYWSMPAYGALSVVGLTGGETVRLGPHQNDRAIWLLGLWGTVLPGLVLLLLVRSVAERIEPGFGTAAAVTVGCGTLILPFGTMFFAHVLAATLLFGAFAILFRERPLRPWKLGAAGLLAGLAVTTEYPAALVGVVLAAYALTGVRDLRGVLGRLWPYALGAFAGCLPLALYNHWAFGSFTKVAYAGLEEHQHGFFGIETPDPGVAVQLLLTSRGLLTLAPVLVMAAVGVVLMYRRGWRPEALAVGAISLVLLIYNSGYFLPFGGHVPGPRFLLLALPFLGIGLAAAFARYPGPTLALGGASVAAMLIPTMTGPAVESEAAAGVWTARLGDGHLQATAFTELGVDSTWLSWAPAIAVLAFALILAMRVSERVPISGRQLGAALAALVAWALFAALGPDALGIDRAAEKTVSLGLPVAHPYGSRPIDTLALIGAVAGIAALAAARLKRSAARAGPARAATAGSPPAGSPSGPAP